MSETMNISAARSRMRTTSLLAACAVVLLAGCAKRDSITVGSVPDDYRTNHPIVISEKEETLDLPVGVSDRGMTNHQKVSLDGFLANYDRTAAPVLRIMVPEGAANSAAASMAASDFARFAKETGVPASRIAILSYQSESPEASSPVRVAFSSMRAQTGKCGRWPEDIANTEDNKHYANFGCSYQNNLAAQIANPADLLGPRKPGPIDAGRRGVAIDGYRNSPYYHAVPTQEVQY